MTQTTKFLERFIDWEKRRNTSLCAMKPDELGDFSDELFELAEAAKGCLSDDR